MKKYIILLLVLFSTFWLGNAALGAIVIGRIAHVEGQISRYMGADETWVETFLDSPVGTRDVLATGDAGRGEIAFPNNLLVRLDKNTEIEISNLADDAGEFLLATGLARFYNQSATGSMTVETVWGTAKVEPGSVADVLVNGNTVIVYVVHGRAIFQTFKNGTEQLEIISNGTSLEFQTESVGAGIGPLDRNWDTWCAKQEIVQGQNQLVRSEHLPQTMQKYAYTVEPYGDWRRVYYRGYYYWAWQPRYVTADWSPFTTGYWYEWQGGPVWIDYNPWGWVTHHHGHWLHMHGVWMWTPYIHLAPVPGVSVAGFGITFAKAYRPSWHPGRVRWVAHSSHIGWLPLAPWETYYGNRKWGPGSVVAVGSLHLNININLARHRYVDHAVIIPKRHFYRKGAQAGNNYTTVRIKNIRKRDIVNHYKPIATAKEQRYREHGIKKAKTGRKENRTAGQSESRRFKSKQVTLVSKYARPALYGQKMVQRKRITYNNEQAKAKRNVKLLQKNRDFLRARETQVTDNNKRDENRTTVTYSRVRNNTGWRKTASNRNSNKNVVNQEQTETEKEKQVVRAQPHKTEMNPIRKRQGNNQRTGTKGFMSLSFNNRHIR